MKRGKGKLLAGAPKKRGRWSRPAEPTGQSRENRSALVFVLAMGFFILGGVGGFGWAMNRQLRGGILDQRQEAMRRPDWVRVRQLPPAFPWMVAAVVDPGLDARHAFQSQAEGQTLSRDIIHQVHLLEDGPGAEARELVMAPLLESHLSRGALIELYLNRVYFGESGEVPVFGVFHASREYFGKPAQQLSLGESATLAGLLLEPRLRHPDRMPGAVGARRNEVLRRLLHARVIEAEDYRTAIAEPLAFQPGVEYLPMTRPPNWDEPVPVM
nr:transglycosylase domain-containing protein [Gemmatimonadota bacterium]